jgi:hypothetical protein
MTRGADGGKGTGLDGGKPRDRDTEREVKPRIETKKKRGKNTDGE